MAEDIIASSQSTAPVVGVITEPIQSEGGDNYASKEFFQVLLKVFVIQMVLHDSQDC